MFGMPPHPPNQSMTTISPAIGQTGSPAATQSKIDPNQIPRPVPNSSVILFDTRQGNQASLPPVLSQHTWGLLHSLFYFPCFISCPSDFTDSTVARIRTSNLFTVAGVCFFQALIVVMFLLYTL